MYATWRGPQGTRAAAPVAAGTAPTRPPRGAPGAPPPPPPRRAPGGGPRGSRRRTAGLRREEVAMLASLSTTYYTFLEQGRPVRPSAQVLDALAAALRMSAAERRYLYVLAYGPGDASGSAQGAPGAP